MEKVNKIEKIRCRHIPLSKYNTLKSVRELNTLKTIGKKALKDCNEQMTFSRFPYYIEKAEKNKSFNSWLSMKKYHAGNCVTFAYFIRDIFIQKGFSAFLIPAETPIMYRNPACPAVSHVAVVVPFIHQSRRGYLLLDSAFYFPKAVLLVDKGDADNGITQKSLRLSTPYSPMKFLYNFGLEKQIPTREKVKELGLVCDRYSIGRELATLCPCANVEIMDPSMNPLETIYYYFCEILNPDKSITTFTNRLESRVFLCRVLDNGKMWYYVNIDKERHTLHTRYKQTKFPTLSLSPFVSKDETSKKITIHYSKLDDTPFFKMMCRHLPKQCQQVKTQVAKVLREIM